MPEPVIQVSAYRRHAPVHSSGDWHQMYGGLGGGPPTQRGARGAEPTRMHRHRRMHTHRAAPVSWGGAASQVL